MTPAFYVGFRLEAPAWKDFYPAHYPHLNFVELAFCQDAKLPEPIPRQVAELQPGFVFSVRLPSHLLRGLDSLPSRLKLWTRDLEPFRQSILSLVIEVPAELTLADDREWLESVLGPLSALGHRLAVQFGHHSWYQDITYNMLARHEAALVWSDSHSNPVMPSKLAYIESGSALGAKRWIDVIYGKYPDAEAVAVVAPSPDEAAKILDALPEASRSNAVNSSRRRKWDGRIIACIDLNAFYPSCEELRDPGLKGKAHAVIMTDEPRGQITRGVVSSCSYEARKYGVRSAMPLARAMALCPGMILLPVDIPYYSTVSDRVMVVLEGFADTFEQASIDEAFLECSEKIAGQTPEQYALAMKKAVAEGSGLLCSVGIAPTKSAAKIACDFRKPDGLTVVYPDGITEFLAPLEVGKVAGIGPKTEQALKDMGIATLGQLAGADVQGLVERFGKNGQWMWSVANGTESDQVVPREGHVSISTEYTLSEFTDDKSKLLSLLQELVPEIYQRAKRHDYTFRTVGIKLVRTDFAIETRETTFAEPQDTLESIASSIGMLLDRFSFDNALRVRKIGIRLTHLQGASKSEMTAQKSLMDYL